MKVLDTKFAVRVVHEERKGIIVVITFYPVRGRNMAHKLKYDSDADVLLVLLKGKRKLSHAEEVGDVVLHVDTKGNPLFFEVLNGQQDCADDGSGHGEGRSQSHSVLKIDTALRPAYSS